MFLYWQFVLTKNLKIFSEHYWRGGSYIHCTGIRIHVLWDWYLCPMIRVFMIMYDGTNTSNYYKCPAHGASVYMYFSHGTWAFMSYLNSLNGSTCTSVPLDPARAWWISTSQKTPKIYGLHFPQSRDPQNMNKIKCCGDTSDIPQNGLH